MNQRHELISRSKSRRLKPKTVLLWVVVFGLFVVAFMAKDVMTKADTTPSTTFQAGNIMSDAVMSNSSTMSVAQIQSFLSSKNACNDTIANHSSISWKYNSDKTEAYFTSSSGKIFRYYISGGKFICMANQKFDGQSAAQIIYQAAQDYHINPQVLIVLLQKEQGLVTDTWPNYNHQYAAATGYRCPDTVDGCDNSYSGFKNQIREATALFNTVLSGGWSNYPVGTNYIQYNPSTSCGGSNVNIQNLATSALYRYTPYQPNAATLAANIGQTVTCGAYGNLNFFRYFNMWFGDTHYAIQGSIAKYYNSANNASILGLPTENESETANGGWKQCFVNGCIVGSRYTGYWSIKGSIGKYYWSHKGPMGQMGLPINNEALIGQNIFWQKYQGGFIIGNYLTSYWSVKGSIGHKYNPVVDTQTLGIPLSDEESVATSIWQQKFSNGYIVGSSSSGYWISSGDTRSYWLSQKGFNGQLGLPTGPITDIGDGEYQLYQGGAIIGNSTIGFHGVKGSIGALYTSNINRYFADLGFPVDTEKNPDKAVWQQEFEKGYLVGDYGKYFESKDPIRSYWQSLDSWNGKMGMVSGAILASNSDAIWQHFDNGVIIVNPANDEAWESKGSIRGQWGKLGYQDGSLGYPTGPEVHHDDGSYSQTYEHGIIYSIHGKTWFATN